MLWEHNPDPPSIASCQWLHLQKKKKKSGFPDLPLTLKNKWHACSTHCLWTDWLSVALLQQWIMLANLVLCVVHVLLHGNWNNFYEKCDIALRKHVCVPSKFYEDIPIFAGQNCKVWEGLVCEETFGWVFAGYFQYTWWGNKVFGTLPAAAQMFGSWLDATSHPKCSGM